MPRGWNRLDWYSDDRERLSAEQKKMAKDAALLFRMPEPFRVLAQRLLRSLADHPEARNIAGRALVEFARESLAKRKDNAPKVH